MVIMMALSLQRTETRSTRSGLPRLFAVWTARITSALGAKRFDVMLPSDYPFPGYKLVRTMPTTCLSPYTLSNIT